MQKNFLMQDKEANVFRLFVEHPFSEQKLCSTAIRLLRLMLYIEWAL